MSRDCRIRLALLALVAALSWGAREARSARFQRLAAGGGQPAPAAEWFSAEPDGLYHVRRVERALAEGLPPAPRDPAMAFPAGAPIPWPPYYDALLAVAARPVVGPPPAGDRTDWRNRLERFAATLPVVFGAATSVAAAAAGAALAGPPGLLAVGLLHALSYGAIHYSVPGVADHHAFVSLLLALLLLLVAEAIRRRAFARPGAGWRFGAAAGVAAGLLLGTWVASLVFVVVVQAALGLWVVWVCWRRRPAPGLAPFGLGFHLAALLTVLPAVLQSPWRETQPWMVVNLSWFHPLHLAAGAVVFLPLWGWPVASPWRRRWPFLVAGALAAAAAALALAGAGPVAGIREGFAWAARANVFMGDIAESQPLLGPDRYGTGGLFGWLGYTVLLVPAAWPFGLWALRRRPDLLPWLVALPVLLAQALAQRRFAADAALPLAVLVGWGLASGLPRGRWRWLALPAAVLLQLPGVAKVADGLAHRRPDQTDLEAVRMNGLRAAHEWLGAHAAPDSSVMAHWDQGHAIELLTGMGSVATNFGSYVGEEGFTDAARFFTAQDLEAAEWLLDRHRCRYVLVHGGPLWAWDQLRAAAGGTAAEAWRSSLAGILYRPDAAPPWLRLRWVAPFRDPDLPDGVLPAVALIYEHVPGARLEASVPPGAEVELGIPVAVPGGVAAFTWRIAAAADAGGRVRFRLPYPGKAVLSWEAGRIEVAVSEEAVATGARLTAGDD